MIPGRYVASHRERKSRLLDVYADDSGFEWCRVVGEYVAWPLTSYAGWGMHPYVSCKCGNPDCAWATVDFTYCCTCGCDCHACYPVHSDGIHDEMCSMSRPQHDAHVRRWLMSTWREKHHTICHVPFCMGISDRPSCGVCGCTCSACWPEHSSARAHCHACFAVDP